MLTRSRLPLFLLVALGALSTVTMPTRSHGSSTDCARPNIRCLSNSRLTVAIDLEAGGSVVRISDHANPAYPNLINHKDLGREAQIALRGAFVSREARLTQDFKGVQNYRAWAYRFGVGPAIHGDMVFDAAAERWHVPAAAGLLLGADWAHPGERLDAIRTWQALTDGIAHVRGVVRTPGGCNAGEDGVRLTIFRGDAQAWGPALVRPGEEVAIDTGPLPVNRGQLIKLVVNRNSNMTCDTTYFLGPDGSSPTFSVDFAGTASDPHQWHPVQAGAEYTCDQKSHVALAEAQPDGRYHTVTNPRLFWQCPDTPLAAVEFEQWVGFEGDNTVRLDYRVIVPQDTPYRFEPGPEAGTTTLHEIPAVYAISPLNRFFTYSGVAPWTGDTLTQLPNSTDNVYFQATEGWAALVDATGYGITIVHLAGSDPALPPAYWEVRDNTLYGGTGEDSDGTVHISAIPVWGSDDLPLDGSARVADYSGQIFLVAGTLEEGRRRVYELAWGGQPAPTTTPTEPIPTPATPDATPTTTPVLSPGAYIPLLTR